MDSFIKRAGHGERVLEDVQHIEFRLSGRYAQAVKENLKEDATKMLENG